MSFNTEYSLYKEFTEDIKHNNRFFVKKEITDTFDFIIENSQQIINKGEKLYRGRVLPEKIKREYKPLKLSEYGIPPEKHSVNGRANPIGINYLYLAVNPDTVIAELRENIGRVISIGTFIVESNINVVKLDDFASSPTREFNYPYFALLLSAMLSRPINKENASIDYLPSQFFAEYCKNKENIGGLKFLSSVMSKNTSKRNFNVTLFDETKIRCIDSKLYQIDNIKYKFQELT